MNGETGRFPICVNLYSRMISHWAKLLSGYDNYILNALYKFPYIQYLNGTIEKKQNPGFNVFLEF